MKSLQLYHSYFSSSRYAVRCLIYSLFAVFLSSSASVESGWATRDKTESDETEKTVQFEGVIEPGGKYALYLQPGESVVRLFISEDQKVESGELVARLVNEKLFSLFSETVESTITALKQDYNLEKLRIQLQSLEESRKGLEEVITKMDRLSEDGHYSSLNEKLVTIRENYHALTREVQLTRKEIELHERIRTLYLPVLRNKEIMALTLAQKIERLDIHAPLSGRIRYVHEEPDRAVAGDKLLEIWNTEKILIRAFVVQNQVEYLQVGDEVKIFFDYFSAEYYLGTVTEICHGTFEHDGSGRKMNIFPVLIEPKSMKNARIGNEVIIKLDL
jgi:multidrug efflux pump subunit AcrA (membrane-fusion protein)